MTFSSFTLAASKFLSLFFGSNCVRVCWTSRCAVIGLQSNTESRSGCANRFKTNLPNIQREREIRIQEQTTANKQWALMLAQFCFEKFVERLSQHRTTIHTHFEHRLKYHYEEICLVFNLQFELLAASMYHVCFFLTTNFPLTHLLPKCCCFSLENFHWSKWISSECELFIAFLWVTNW